MVKTKQNKQKKTCIIYFLNPPDPDPRADRHTAPQTLASECIAIPCTALRGECPRATNGYSRKAGVG